VAVVPTPPSHPLDADAFETAAVALFIADDEGRVLAGNREFRELTGRGAEERTALADLLHWSEREHACLSAGLADLGLVGPLEVRGRDGRLAECSLELRARALGEGGSRRYCGALLDITERRRREEELRHDASHDALTGLPRRPLIMERIEQALAHAGRDPSYRFAILFLDFDRFKVINDSFGHLIGDRLLGAAVERIRACLQRAGDSIARFGGDEFVILLDDCRDSAHAARVAERIQASLCKPFSIADQELFTGSSIGIVVSEGADGDADRLLRDADTAMYRAKAQGKGGYEIFDRDMHEAAVALSRREMELRRAVEREDFELFYQPMLAVGSAEVLGFEAFLRWRGDHGLILPAAFLKLAEETGLIVRIGDWVLRRACAQAQGWRTGGANLRLTVNLSTLQFQQRDLPARVARALAESGLEPGALQLEVTEGSILEDPDRGIATLEQLREIGVGLVVDDFGTGCFSLAQIRKLPVDAIKIDDSLVAGLLRNSGDAAIIKAVIDLGHSLGLRVLAEGVEDARQVTFLRAHGCDVLQGNYFQPPLAVADLQILLERLEAIAGGDAGRLRLPGHSSTAAAALDLGTGEPAAPRRVLDGVRVLVIEDEDSSRYTLARILEFHGAETSQAATGAEALAMIQSARPDILVCDIGLPDQDGYSLLAQIRGLPGTESATPAVALTGYARSEDRVRALEAGFQSHAAKPVQPAELVAVVASLAGMVGARARPPAAESSPDPA
jgi:diguanylate cyclase (GGDEF)-like protein/PAS domain S-box-containing protein